MRAFVPGGKDRPPTRPVRPHLYRLEASLGTNGSTFTPGHLFTRYKWPKHLFVPGEEKAQYKCEVICTRRNYTPVLKPTTSPVSHAALGLTHSPLFLYFSSPLPHLSLLPYLFFFLFFNSSHLSSPLIQTVDRSRGGRPEGHDAGLPGVGAYDLSDARAGARHRCGGWRGVGQGHGTV
jgi:hypothetical protein